MPVLKNTNPMGDVDLPLIYRQGDDCLKAGEEFEVDEEQARNLLAQTGNYEPVNDAAKKVAAQLLVAADEPPAMAQGGLITSPAPVTLGDTTPETVVPLTGTDKKKD